MTRRSKRERNAWVNAWADAMRAGALGWDLAVPICGGAVLGHFLDQQLGTGHVYTIGLLVGGISVGVYNVFHRLQAEIERDRKLALRPKTDEDEWD